MSKAARIRAQRQAQRPWQPLERAVTNPEESARAQALAEAAGLEGDLRPDDEIWLSDEYQVHVRYEEKDSQRGREGFCSLSIKRRDKTPVSDWRDKQAIKNEILGPEREAVEIYPAESRLVDSADQAWLWVFPADTPLPIGFRERLVVTDEDRVAAFASVDPIAATKGSQREWRPGIPTGPSTGGDTT